MILIQWNINGFYNNFFDIQRLVCDLDPHFICLQETHLGVNDVPKLRNYSIIANINAHSNSSGGVAICISNRSNIKFSEINLNSPLDAVAIKTVYKGRELSVCSLYLKPNMRVEPSELQRLSDQIPSPKLIVGDFNAHNQIWGSARTCSRGRTIENFLLNNELVFLNKGKNTYFHPGFRTLSAIDLALCSSQILHAFDWDVLDLYHSSDHFPIKITEINAGPDIYRRQRWKEKDVDWIKFGRRVEETLPPLDYLDLDNAIDKFTETVQNVANEMVPKTSIVPKVKQKAWWNDNIASLSKECKKAYRKACQNLTDENDRNYRALKAELKKQCLEAKKKTWQDYVRTIDANTTSGDMWHKINRIRGTYKTQIINQIKSGNSIVTTPMEIGNSLAKYFQNNSKDDPIDSPSMNRKKYLEASLIQISNEPAELSMLDVPFSLNEMNTCMRKAKGKSPGPDTLTYNMLKNLDLASKSSLLTIYNRILESGVFPEVWKVASVVPILKPDKDPLSVESYRPISLLNCSSKIFEKMIAKRLNWWLESNNKLSERQYGFRNSRSTNDNVTFLQNYIAVNRQEGNHTIAVSLDISKAYEKVWRVVVLKQLHEWGLNGSLISLIDNFMQNRKIQVLIGNQVSHIHILTNGVPQGSSLSVTLFLIAINSVTKEFDKTPGIEFLLYADDIIIFSSHPDYDCLILNIQNALNNIMQWADLNGFNFSAEKTQAIHFCHKRICQDPEIFMGQHQIQFVDDIRILGVQFDRKLLFNKHLDKVKNSLTKNLNLVRNISSQEWGSNQEQLLNIVNALICSRIEYCSTAISTTNTNNLNKLNPILNAALRASTGAFRSSPINSIMAVSNFTPLDIRRSKINVKYFTKSVSYDRDLIRSQYDFPLRFRKPIPFIITAQQDLERFNISTANLKTVDPPTQPPWYIRDNMINFSLSILKKSETSPAKYVEEFNKVISRFSDYTKVFTDGSKSDSGVAFATYYVRNESLCTESQVKIPEFVSIFASEAKAILSGCDIPWYDGEKRIILSDSMSVLQAISNLENSYPTVTKIRDRLIQHYPNLRLMWIPSHVGIEGNEIVDSLAKTATLREGIDDQSHYSIDLVNLIQRNSREMASESWSRIYQSDGLAKLGFSIQLFQSSSLKYTRRDRVVLNRLLIGHTKLTHGFLMSKDLPPICDTCNVQISVIHIFAECPKYTQARQYLKYKNCDSILSFLRHIGIYDSI